ncbi:MAG: SpoIIE family protein phosphatase [Desulfuromonadaceae bacterium]|nr:SpoIIE family protein phosphatase [Desulfuromonas sp.]MDY0185427.1 SpoIIE family protein phosphatase [Desulfuromonadaceae bacterium]
MLFKRFHPKTIKTRILYALLGTATISLVCFGMVALWGMVSVGKSSLRGTLELSQDLLEISKGSLESLTQEGLLKATVDQAAFINSQFREVENDLKILVDSAERIWKTPDVYPQKRSYSITQKPDAPETASVWQIPQDVPLALVATELQISAKMDEIVSSVVKSNPNINDCNVATPLGLFRRLPWSPNIVAAYDVRTRDWFNRALQSNTLGWSEPYVGVIARNLRVNCSAPVIKDEKVVAVIGLNVPLTTIQERIIKMRINNQGRAYLISRDRRILAHEGLVTDSNRWGEKQNEDYFSFDDQQAMPVFDQLLTSGTPGILRGILGEQDSFVAYAPIRTTGWTVLFALPVENVFAQIRPTEQALLAQAQVVSGQIYRQVALAMAVLGLVFLSMLAGVMLVSRRMAERITAPIMELEQGAKIIGDGNLAHRLLLKTGDEIQQLGETFNRMAEDLSNYIRDLTETTAAKERIQSELKVATDIQVSLLPRVFPAFPHRPEVEIYASMDPAKEVGGDFYDFFFVDKDRLCFLIADVADKGVPAALYMMVAKTLLKTEAQRGYSPEKVLEEVNNILADGNDSCTFVTVFLAILDTRTGEVQLANAGHNPPIIVRQQGSAYLTIKPGIVLGPMPDLEYTNEVLILHPGDTLFLYTDGVTEATNAQLELFSEARLLDALQSRTANSMEELVHAIRNEVQLHANGAAQSDDVTMLAIKYKGVQE